MLNWSFMLNKKVVSAAESVPSNMRGFSCFHSPPQGSGGKKEKESYVWLLMLYTVTPSFKAGRH